MYFFKGPGIAEGGGKKGLRDGCVGEKGVHRPLIGNGQERGELGKNRVRAWWGEQ